MKANITQYFYVFSILFFTLGFFNILFGWLGLICMLMPFLLLARDKKKTWCSSYCPRSKLFDFLFKNNSVSKSSGPQWLIRGKGKWIMLFYFSLNLFAITMSTIAVSKGKILPMEYIRFMMFFPIPFDVPQLFQVNWGADWVVHFAYRMYSMMFTTTILGILLGWFFKPRTWCTVCPINTVSGLALNERSK